MQGLRGSKFQMFKVVEVNHSSKVQSCQVAKVQSYKVAKLQRCKVLNLPTLQPCKSSKVRRFERPRINEGG